MNPLDALKVKDMIPQNVSTYEASKYSLFYEQDRHKFNNMPHMYAFFLEDKRNIAYCNDFHSFIEFRLAKGSKITPKQLAEMLLDTFAFNPNVIISLNTVKDTKEFIDESFDDCRLRKLWETLDYLGKPHHGYGNFIGQKKVLKHYRPRGKAEEIDGQLTISLD